MVVARASGMDLASSLKQNTFLTLGVCPTGGPHGTEEGPSTHGHPWGGTPGHPWVPLMGTHGGTDGHPWEHPWAPIGGTDGPPWGHPWEILMGTHGGILLGTHGRHRWAPMAASMGTHGVPPTGYDVLKR